MALNGTKSVRLMDGEEYGESADLIFSWEVLSQSSVNNTSTVKWSLEINLDTDIAFIYTTNRIVRSYGTTIFRESTNRNFWGRNSTHYIVADGTEVIEHNPDGTKNLNFYVVVANRRLTKTGNLMEEDVEITVTDELDAIARGAQVLTASNFNDTENPSISYQAGGSDLVKLELGLSLDGETLDIPYVEVATNSTQYTFNLTEAQRESLRAKVQGSSSVPIYYMVKTTYTTFTSVTKAARTFTIIGCDPVLTVITLKDINSKTLALTGDENTFVKYESMAEYAFTATASKGATIVSQSVTCGSKTITGLPNGVIDDVESGTFTFSATDSRSMGVSTSVFKNLIEYVKPTCYQKLSASLIGETGAQIKLTINGNYFTGSFGAAENLMLLEVRHTNSDGVMGDWEVVAGTDSETYNNNTYEFQTTFGGFDYGKSYTFQTRISDLLNVVESAQYTIRLLPVFDWSETDFNFNVPVNINAEDLTMHGETILRHSNDTNNTVLSATGGHIYIRPGGTTSTSGETIIYPDGSIKFGGTVTFADGTTGGGASDPTADYVIETGEEAMGSNGTWYWRKWNSGKAEAWGCRNFGNAAVTTAWGNLYRSAIFTQDLPNNVFIRTPDAININIVHSNFGGWICKHEQTAPSADTTGSFIFVRPASATVSPTNIGFYIVGEWQ